MQKLEIPTFEEVEKKYLNREAMNPLEIFIYDNSPVIEDKFRKQLQELVDFVRSNSK